MGSDAQMAVTYVLSPQYSRLKGRADLDDDRWVMSRAVGQSIPWQVVNGGR